MYRNLKTLLKNVSINKLDEKTSLADNFFGGYSTVNISNQPNYKFLRIQKKKGFFANSEFIGGIDLINDCNDKNCTKIEFIYAGNNSAEGFENKETLDALMSYAIREAKKNNSTMLKIDVHGNLKRYEKYIKNYGFELNGKKCDDNPFWLEAEMKL